MKAAEALSAPIEPVSARETVECVAAPRSEPPPEDPTDARVDRLIAENLALMVERKQLREVADARANRANECLKHARDARILIRAYVDAREACSRAFTSHDDYEAVHTAVSKAQEKEEEAYAALVAFVSKPL